MTKTDRERIKQRAAELKQAKPAAVAVVPTPVAAPPPKKPKEAGPKLTHKCGHSIGVRDYENIDCPACRGAARQERAARRREQQPKAQATPYTIGRLPHGSRYAKVYDGDKREWTGTLTIPDGPTFTGTASAEKKVEHLLDRQYREWLAGKVVITLPPVFAP